MMASLPGSGLPAGIMGAAMAMAQAAGMGQGQGQGQGIGLGIGQAPPTAMPAPGGPGGVGGGTSFGKSVDAENDPVKPGPAQWAEAQTQGDSRVPGRRQIDANFDRQGRGQDAWFTTLPKNIRESMKSREKRSLPRGYEDRLKAYFENLD